MTCMKYPFNTEEDEKQDLIERLIPHPKKIYFAGTTNQREKCITFETVPTDFDMLWSDLTNILTVQHSADQSNFF